MECGNLFPLFCTATWRRVDHPRPPKAVINHSTQKVPLTLLRCGVRKFISAFLRCVVQKQANKDTAGGGADVLTSHAKVYAECGRHEEVARTADKAELFEPREAIPGVLFLVV